MKLRWLAGVFICFAFTSDAPVRPDAFLKTGNEITYSAIARVNTSNTEHDRMVVRIKNVEVNGTHISSSAMMAIYREQETDIRDLYTMNFACDSLNFYVYATNWLYRDAVPRAEMEYRYSGDSLIYPLNMKVGDTLPGASAKKYWKSPKGSGGSTTTFLSRKVTAHDTLDLACGKIPAFRIDFSIRMSDVYTGKPDALYDVTEWFSPSIGVIKTEYQLGKGKAVMTLSNYTK